MSGNGRFSEKEKVDALRRFFARAAGLLGRLSAAARRLFPRKRAKTFRRERGDAGEQFAADFWKKRRGMKILRRNFRAGKDEIDIVARDGETLVFVEVKTRAEGDPRGAVFAVDARKRRALRRAADAFLGAMRERPRASRLDVVEVYVSEADGSMRAVHHRALSWRGTRC